MNNWLRIVCPRILDMIDFRAVDNSLKYNGLEKLS